MAKYKVLFLPANKEIEVDAGSTILKAAEKVGVYLNSLCGGEGVCGKCRVQVSKGKVNRDEHTLQFFKKDELDKGYVLACQTLINDNLEVIVPPESIIEDEQILTATHVKEQTTWQTTIPITYSQPEWISVRKWESDPTSSIHPAIQKTYLKLPEPTGDDNIPDTGRIQRELQKAYGYEFVEFTLYCLQELSQKLRNSGWQITCTINEHNSDVKILYVEEGDTTCTNYGAAVDVGTTTVVAQVVNLKTGEVIGVEGSHNLQAHYGEDVLSRIAYVCSKGALDVLQKAVVQNINELLQSISRRKNINPTHINYIVAAGNPTMSHLLLGLTPCSIRNDPYVPTVDFYPQIYARDIGVKINPMGIIEVLPSIASYVGGDTVAGVLACGMHDRTDITCLIDVGTNGEIAIGNSEWIMCCSASAGPAFEGGDIKCGMRATRGAIQKIEINNGNVKYDTIGNVKPRGICGSGIVDLIYELAKNRIIDIDGKFRNSINDKRYIRDNHIPEYIIAYPEETENGQMLTITQTDIDNVIRSKGAIFAAIKSITDYIGMTFDQLNKIYIAGGFGNYLDINKAIGIGLIPDIPRERIEFIGNSSLMGARMCLLSIETMKKALNIARGMTNIELSRYAPFADEYIAALYLPHIHREQLFPSVNY